jgi:hypothetical protein
MHFMRAGKGVLVYFSLEVVGVGGAPVALAVPLPCECICSPSFWKERIVKDIKEFDFICGRFQEG